MPTNKINTQLAYILLNALQQKGYSCGIMGGYARDSFFGIEPKDMDVCVAVGNVDDGEVEDIISQISNILFCATLKAGLYPERKVMGMYNDHASDRACGVIQYPDDHVDVILYRDCHTAHDILEAFDFNLNQFALDGKHDTEPMYFGDTDLRVLRVVRPDCSAERALKVQRKHVALLPAIRQAYSEGRLV